MIQLSTIKALAEEWNLQISRIVKDSENDTYVFFFGGEKLPDGGFTLQAALILSEDGIVDLYLRDRRKAGSVIKPVGDMPHEVDAVMSELSFFLKTK